MSCERKPISCYPKIFGRKNDLIVQILRVKKMAVLNERGHHQTNLEPLKYLFFISSVRDANAHGMEWAGLEPVATRLLLREKNKDL